ncbi:hypothetical protein PIB30_008063 [Stylosanthes scabra]|uniref:GRF-type domain-containing protein n=1 Tax=Stylosanthes scabra TaxID=79078 RepID=A0ABU6W4Y2_9FABA|nr:hypothetical protein [Stylosanthes scabra]
MESNGGAGSSRRSDRSSSSTQGVYLPRPGEERDVVAPKCRCGVYAILYLSRTEKNPNRLFFGCPFFRGGFPLCKFFEWLDRYTAKLLHGAAIENCGEEGDELNVHFSRMELEWRVAELEKRIGCLEERNKEKNLVWLYVMCLASAVFAVCVVWK